MSARGRTGAGRTDHQLWINRGPRSRCPPSRPADRSALGTGARPVTTSPTIRSVRMRIVGYCFGIRSERRLCDEVHRNLAYRWFCGLGLDGDVPDHSTFSKNRHGRFRESDLRRKLFETVVARCIRERLVGGEAFAVDASMIVADAHRRGAWPRSRISTQRRAARSRSIYRFSMMRPSAAHRRASRRRSRRSIRQPA